MFLRMPAVFLIAASLASCAGLDGDEPVLEGWTVERLSVDGASGEPVRAPVFIPERVLGSGTLASIAASERAVLQRGSEIRAAAASVIDPEEPAEDFAVRQRARATPPE